MYPIRTRSFALLAASTFAAACLHQTPAAQAAVPQAEAWIGTWKLDKAHSHFTGDTVTFTSSAPGMYHFEDGSAASYDFGVDGKEYPGAYGRTVVWRAVGDRAWDGEIKANGAVLYKVHREISPDEKTMTVVVTGSRPDGTPLNEKTVYNRLTGTLGLVGTWQDVKTSAASPDTFVISSGEGGTLHYDIPSWHESADTALDGTDAPIKGERVAAGMTIGLKLVSPRKITYVMKFQGKPDMYGESTLAADGKSYTDVSWAAGREKEKQEAVYRKQ
jgi:hypothetical protein